MNLSAILQEALAAVAAANDIPALEEVRVTFMGKKGSITELLKSLGAMDPEQRKIAGQQINELKQQVQDALNEKRDALQHPIEPEYIAFEVPEIFFLGYGLDYDGRGRNLPCLYRLAEG